MSIQKPFQLTDADRASFLCDDGRDTPFRDRQSMSLNHATSPALVIGGSAHVPGAVIGGYTVSLGDERVPMASVLFQVIAFTLSHPEYTVGLGDGDRGVFVCDHGVAEPSGMKFLKQGERGVAKAGFYRINDGRPGNKVVPTVTAYGLVDGHGISYAMYGTAFKPGKDWVIRAERLRAKAEIDGKIEELRGCTLGRFKLTSAIEKKGMLSYPVPVITLVGKLGEAGGPTFEQWLLVKQLRKAFKDGDWTPAEAIDPPDPPPALEEPQRGSIDVRSGSGAWNNAPLPDRYDGPDDDSNNIDF